MKKWMIILMLIWALPGISQKVQKDSAALYINTNIKNNGVRAITGSVMNAALNNILNAVIDSIYRRGDSILYKLNGAEKVAYVDTSGGGGGTTYKPGAGITIAADTIKANVTTVAGRTGAVVIDTSDIAGFYTKVRSLLSAGSHITLVNGQVTATPFTLQEALNAGDSANGQITLTTGGDIYFQAIGGDVMLGQQQTNVWHVNESIAEYKKYTGDETYLSIDVANNRFYTGLPFASVYGKRIQVDGTEKRIQMGDIDNVNNGGVLIVDDLGSFASYYSPSNNVRFGIGNDAPDSTLDVTGGLKTFSLRVTAPVTHAADTTTYKIGVLSADGTMSKSLWPRAASLGGATLGDTTSTLATKTNLLSYLLKTGGTLTGPVSVSNTTLSGANGSSELRFSLGSGSSQGISTTDGQFTIGFIDMDYRKGLRTYVSSATGNVHIDGFSDGVAKNLNYPIVIGARANNTGTSQTGIASAENGSNVQIGFQTSDIPSAVLALNSTTRGFRPALWTNTQMNAISSPATALTGYSTSDSSEVVYDGVRWYFVPKAMKGAVTLDFPSTAASSSSDLTFTVTGARPGDQALITTADGSQAANSTITATVIGLNTVSARLLNNSGISALDPASTTYAYKILKQ